ncbi:MAG: hypothetical protein JWM11_5923 [Planctomycetaceae bacterium]|nr:hypothetical protein [Planctomycetaceae bacterium]
MQESHSVRKRSDFLCPAFLVVASVLIGCGSGSELKLSPVKGTVAVAGNPLAEAGISFRADESKGNKTKHIPSATSDDEGNYELVTGGEKGAPPGWYKVVVIPSSPPIVGGEMPKPGPPPFDKKYLDPGATDLSVEVKDGATPDDYNLELKK